MGVDYFVWSGMETYLVHVVVVVLKVVKWELVYLVVAFVFPPSEIMQGLLLALVSPSEMDIMLLVVVFPPSEM